MFALLICKAKEKKTRKIRMRLPNENPCGKNIQMCNIDT